MEKLEHVIAIIGAIGVICGLLSRLLPEGKAKDVLEALGFNLAKATGRAIELKPQDVKLISEKEMVELLKKERK